MPKIPSDWKWNGTEVFAANTEWQKTGKFESNVPSYETLTSELPILEQGVGPLVIMEGSVQNTLALQGRQILQVGIHLGFDEARLAIIGEDLPKAAQVSATVFINAAEGIVTSVALDALKNVMDSITGIPIVGWIIDIAYGLGVTIYEAVTMFDAQEIAEEQLRMPGIAKYSRAVDEDLTTALLVSLQQETPTTDWTPYFLPRGRRRPELDAVSYKNYCGFEHGAIDSLTREERAIHPGVEDSPTMWGVDWDHEIELPPDTQDKPSGYYSEFPAWGGVPGLAKVQWDWQVARYDIVREKTSLRTNWPAGDPELLGHGPMNDTGDFAPSVKQALFTMWGQVVSNAGVSFQVDPERLHTRWMDAYLALKDYITYLALRDKNDATDRHIAYALTLMNMSAVYNVFDKPAVAGVDGVYGGGEEGDPQQGRWPGPHLDFWGSTDDNFNRDRYTLFQAGGYAGAPDPGYTGGPVFKGLHFALQGDPAQGLLETHPDLVTEYVMQALEDGFGVPMPTWYGPSWVKPKDRQDGQGKDAVDVAKWACEHPFAGIQFGWQEQAILYWPIVKMMIDNFRDLLHQKFVYTTTIAYVDENYAAIRGHSGLRQKWRTLRQALLQNSARMTVDLDLIPDADYRNAMAAAQQAFKHETLAPPDLEPGPIVPAPPGFADLNPLYSPPPPPGDGAARDSSGRRFTTGEKVAVAAGLGGALWYLARVGRGVV